jgi:hypothetical protein
LGLIQGQSICGLPEYLNDYSSMFSIRYFSNLFIWYGLRANHEIIHSIDRKDQQKDRNAYT